MSVKYQLYEDVKKRIRHLRILVSLHSYMYYEVGYPQVTDKEWETWAVELKSLQDSWGYRWDVKYDKWFKGWDANTGYHLCNIPGLRESAIKVYPKLFKELKYV